MLDTNEDRRVPKGSLATSERTGGPVGQSSEEVTRYLQAKALISRVYKLPEAERDGFVHDACASNQALQEEVLWLLAGLRAPEDTFLERPLVTDLCPPTRELHVPAPRDYTLLRPLGEGGVGVVYLAQRVEGELRQSVALKLLNPIALCSPSVTTRFLAERQILARLSHPNIARLIDAGALADGQPFMAMEYIDGHSIDKYCVDRQLSLDERLQLFLKVCDAVQHAHDQLIIHRDLKPANVLVTRAGEPKLVDFGIARSLGQAFVEPTATVAGQRMMTMAYASPEQISGKPLTVATDVYSLGVILYELVTGRHPWGTAEDASTAARRIAGEDPESPSVAYARTRATTPGHRGRNWRLQLPADLDSIIMKALRFQVHDRYVSVEALAEDLRRLRGTRPVAARQGHTTYVVRKFVCRHRIVLAAGALLLALGIGFTINQAQQLEQIRQQETKLRQEEAKVRQVRNFLAGLFAPAQPTFAKGMPVTARELLDRGAERLQHSFDNDPATKVGLLNALALTYQGLGELQRASDAAAQAVQLARESPGVSKQVFVDALLDGTLIEGFRQRGTVMEPYAREAIVVAQSNSSIKPTDLPRAHCAFGLALSYQEKAGC